MIATVDEGFAYLESFTNFERMTGKMRPWRLERMAELCRRAGNPEQRLSVFHIAGSKGKGSTATYLAALAEAAGDSTGLYTSPHLEDYRERITRAGEFLPEESYLRGLRRIEEIVEEIKSEGHRGDALPSTFELLTLLAFDLFGELRRTVLETGLGGRLDATNVVTPEATLITPIELEHTEYLGETIPEIAGEKAGIIKREVPLFTAPMRREAEEVIHSRALELSAPHIPYREAISEKSITLGPEGTEIDAELYGSALRFRLPVLGVRQARNALLAAAAARRHFPELSEERIGSALATVRLPGRMELLRVSDDDAPVIIDGAHTPDSVAFLRETVGALFPPPWFLVFGTLKGKKSDAMARELIPVAGEVIVLRPASFRASDLPATAAPFREAGIRTTLFEEASAALTRARSVARDRKYNAVVVTGSFYLAGLARRTLREDEKDRENQGGSELCP